MGCGAIVGRRSPTVEGTLVNVMPSTSAVSENQAPSGKNIMSGTSAATLRIIQVTDVYTLENFPNLKSLIEEKRYELNSFVGGPGKSRTISMLTGDFLMPYLLSSIDGGRGMMQMLNRTPVDYLTWGNHEADLPHDVCCAREREYNGVWINTNMQDHESFANSACQKDAAFVEVRSADGSNVRKVGMIALLTNSESCYRKGRFNGCVIDDPWECMAKYKEKLKSKCDFVLPLCHLYEDQDERTAREFDFPVILSGHDHHVVDRVVNGTRILKPGSDAKKAVILDITWPAAGSCKPVIKAEIVSVKDSPPHPSMNGLVDRYYGALAPLYNTTVRIVPEKFRPLSSVGSRRKCNSFSLYLNSAIREALNSDDDSNFECDCVIINGGCMPRAEHDYAEDEQISLGHLRSELKMETELFVAEVPGAILQDGLKATWDMGPSPSWMQHCNKVEVAADGLVKAIGGKPLDLKAIYRVGTVIDFFSTTYAGPVIGKYFEENPARKPDFDSGVPVEALLLQYWANILWRDMWPHIEINGHGTVNLEEVEKIDVDAIDDDSHISRQDVFGLLKSKLNLSTDKRVSDFADVLLKVADLDGDGTVLIKEVVERMHDVQKKSGRDAKTQYTQKQTRALYRSYSKLEAPKLMGS